jgi:hypothetical protein
MKKFSWENLIGVSRSRYSTNRIIRGRRRREKKTCNKPNFSAIQDDNNNNDILKIRK